MATIIIALNAAPAAAGAKVFAGARSQVVAAARDIDKAVRGADSGLRSFGDAAKSVAPALRQLFLGFTAFTAIRESTEAIADFELTLAQLKGTALSEVESMHALDVQLGLLAETAKTLGATTLFTPGEASEGLLLLAKAGFSVQESMAAIPDTLQLATVGMIDVAEAADFASNIVRQFGLRASETGRVVDDLTVVANKTNTDVKQLAEAMKFAGAVSSSFDKSLEEVSAALGVLSDRGLKGALAGTNLRGIMISLAKPTKDAVAIFKEMGIKLEDINPASNTLVEIFDRLGKAGLTASQFVEIFNAKNVAAALILSRNADKLRDLQKATEDGAGAADKFADIVRDTLSGSFKLFISAVQTLIIDIGDSGLTGALKGMVDAMTSAVRIIGGFASEAEEADKSAQAIAKTVQFLAGAAGFLAVSKAISVVIGTLKALKVELLTNPITLIPGILALAAGAVFAFRHELADLTISGHRLGDILTTVFNELQERFEFIFPRLKVVVEQTLTAIVTFFKKSFDFIIIGANEFLESLGLNWADVWDGMKGFVKSTANFTIATLKTIGDAIGIILMTLGELISNLGKLDFSSPLALSLSAAKVGIDNIKTSVSGLKEIGAAAGDNFTTDFVGAFEDVGKDIMESLVGGFRGLEGEDALKEFFNIFKDFDDNVAKTAAKRQAEAYAEGLKKAGIIGFGPFGMPIFDPAMFGGGEAAAPQVDLGEDVFSMGGGGGRELADFEERLEHMRQETALRKEGIEEIDAEIERRQILSLAIATGNIGLVKEVEEMQNLNDKLENLAEHELLAASFAESIGSFARDVGRDFDSIGDAAENAFKMILDALQEILVIQPLINALKNSFGPGGGNPFASLLGLVSGATGSAKGNIFSGGSIVPFAKGGVLTEPTLFPLAGGKAGLGGEQGDEGLFKIFRDTEGELAVKGSGGGGTSVSLTQNINGVQDFSGFNRSRRQAEQAASNIVRSVR